MNFLRSDCFQTTLFLLFLPCWDELMDLESRKGYIRKLRINEIGKSNPTFDQSFYRGSKFGKFK